MLSTIAMIILAIIVWLLVDLALGRRQQQKNASEKDMPLRHGDINFYAEGTDFFEDLFDAIEQAHDHIHINFFIFRNDTIGKKTIARLKRKASQGVEIRILVDFIGSLKFPKKKRKELESHGIQFAASQKPRLPYLFYSLNKRNHRKITVIDGRLGFVGGFNVGDEYLGKKPELGDWRDYHLMVKEDGVQDLQFQFLIDWKEATGEKVEGKSYYPKLEKGPVAFRLFPTDGAYLEKHFLNLIHGAKKSIVIGSPYYIPGRKVQQALLDARKRGVSVKLLMPLKKDHPLVHEAAVPYFSPLLKAGCEIFLFYQGFYHAKVMIIDEQICDIGTANLDRRSFTFNSEINCYIYNDDIITTVLSALDRDFRRSDKLTLEALKGRRLGDRIRERAASSISGLL
ncbi:MAG TPA: cardiolipin synthase [Bacillales bacterium]|nr:cardiolipin synthase [Bacillales bacterium]